MSHSEKVFLGTRRISTLGSENIYSWSTRTISAIGARKISKVGSGLDIWGGSCWDVGFEDWGVRFGTTAYHFQSRRFHEEGGGFAHWHCDVKRDTNMSKETQICPKRLKDIRRGPNTAKKTQSYQKRPRHVKRDQNMSKETQTCQIRPTYVKENASM